MSRLLPLFVLVSILAACGFGEPKMATFVDLGEALPEARRLHRIATPDLGTARARAALGEGWSSDETSPDGETFVWGLGSSSSLELAVPRARDVEIFLRGQPFTWPDGPDQKVFLSGTKLREMLRAGERPPAEFTRPEVAEVLVRWATSRVPVTS